MKIDFKSKAFWISLASMVVLLVQNIGVRLGFKVYDDVILDIINAVCGILVFVGVLSVSVSKDDEEHGEEHDEEFDEEHGEEYNEEYNEEHDEETNHEKTETENKSETKLETK